VDFARPGADLSGYRLVLVPGLFLISDRAAEGLAGYVRAGGTLVVWYGSGITDPSVRVRLDGYPGALREVLGIRVEEFHPLAGSDPVRLSTGDTGRTWSEHVHLAGAEQVAGYADGALAGHPAITRHRYGDGTAWYVSTALDDLAGFLAGVAGTAGVTPAVAGLPAGVEVVVRRGPGHRWLFVLNHSGRPVDVPSDGFDLVTGRSADGAVPPGGFAVIREELERSTTPSARRSPT
jgi:beta-galactosidase